jgi:hypothetical protein
MSPDPLGIFSSDLSDPQTLNLYAYVRNNPVSLTDPTGLYLFDDGGEGGCDLFCGIGISFGWCDFGCGAGRNGGTLPPISFPPDVGNSPNPPDGTLTSDDPFGGETNGIPNGIGIPYSLAGLVMPGDTGCDFGGCGPFINSWTGEGGFSIQITVWGLAFQAFYGLAIDLHGHVAIYRGGGGGVGLGAKVSTGISLSASNGNTVCALGGPFTNVSGTAGAGAGGTVDVFTGKGDAPGGVVWGAGGTIGPTVGAAGGVTVTGTNVKPLRHRCVNGKLQ